jgi:2-(1,2-epoxy-1,2-dihydrophenyl)acetyl-CoA isomerase
MAGGTVLVEDSGGVRTITLNRADKLNSFTAEMNDALRRALAGADDERVRAFLEKRAPQFTGRKA